MCIGMHLKIPWAHGANTDISLACGRDPVKQGHVVHSTGDHAWSQAPPDVKTIGEQECIVAVICNSVDIHFHSTMVH